MSDIKNLRPSDYPYPQLREPSGAGCAASPCSSRTTCSALVRRCNVCNVITAVDLGATPARWAEMQMKDHTVWYVTEETAIKLWDEEGGKCDHAKFIAKLSPQNARSMASPSDPC